MLFEQETSRLPHLPARSKRRPFPISVTILVTLFLSLAAGLAAAPADASSGSLVGEVRTRGGDAIAGATVRIEGPGGEHATDTGEEGRFRFRRVRPGKYTLEVHEDGELLSRYDAVNVRGGRPTSVTVRVASNPEETLVVTLEPPAPPPRISPDAGAEPGSPGVATLAAELDPFAADDGASVGLGADSVARYPTPFGDARAATDPARHDPLRDALLRLEGAARVATPGGGVTHDGVVALVTERSAARRHGSLRLDASDQGWQGSDVAPTTERIDSLAGAGIDVGTNLFGDALRGWAAYDVQTVDRVALGGQRTSSRSQQWALELRGQAGPSVSWAAGHHRGDRRAEGAGAGLDRSIEATRLELQPSALTTASASWTATPHAVYRVSWSAADDAASLLPFGSVAGETISGLDPVLLDGDGVWRGGYAEVRRRQDVERRGLRAEFEPRSVRGRHLLRFGFEEADLEGSDSERWGAADAILLAGENFGTPFDLLRVRRSGELAVERELTAFWVEESFTLDRLSVDLGLRRDQQDGQVGAGSLAASPLLPELLPAVHDDGRGRRLAWTDLSPRLGLSWAFGSERRTVARAGWGRYVSRLDRDLVARISPLSAAELVFAVDGEDPLHLVGGLPGGDFGGGFLLVDRRGADPLRPGAGVPGRTARDLRAETTEELAVSAEHHLGRSSRLWATYLDRETSGVHESRLLLREADGRVRLADAADYVLSTVVEGRLPDGTPWAAPVYTLADGLEFTGGRQVENGDRVRREERLTVGFERPMTDGFQLRGHASWSDWRWSVGPGFAAHDDPTDAAPGLDPAGLPTADDDGGVVTTAPGRYFVGSRWSFDLTGLFEVAPRKPWGFGVAASVQGREGLPIPYAVDVVSGDRLRRVAAGERTLRLDDVVTVDLRLEKELSVSGLRTVVSLDTYNLLDSGTVLEREPLLGGPQSDAVRRTLSPRVFRLGVRLALP